MNLYDPLLVALFVVVCIAAVVITTAFSIASLVILSQRHTRTRSPRRVTARR